MKPLSDSLSQGLNPAQREAVQTLRGPLLVLAGAGTGKTRVITVRIANIIRHGTPPSRILGVTFTNKAAKEMRERVGKILGKGAEETPLVTTFHSLGVDILRKEADKLGYKRGFTIYDRGDQEGAARSALRQARIASDQLGPGALLAQISNWKMQGILPKALRSDHADDATRLASIAYRHYDEILVKAGAFDFDDLLFRVEQLFREFPETLETHQRRFDYILVDEYQDTNASQYRMVKFLAGGHGNLCVVGDDDQSIYGWRGAEVKNILGFDRDFPSARVIRLEENYRCCPNILKLANQLIRKNLERHPKVLRPSRVASDQPRFEKYEDEEKEAEMVVRDILSTHSRERRPFSDFAVLFRTNEQARPFETQFRAQNVPYVLVGAFSFFDRREIRDIVAYIKVLANPLDEMSLLRIINTPARGVGPSVVEKLLARAVSAGKSLWEVIPSAIESNTLSSKAATGLRQLVATLDESRRDAQPGRLANAIRDLIERVDYGSELAKQHPAVEDQRSRRESINELLNMLTRHDQGSGDRTLGGFLERITLESQETSAEKDRKRDAVMLITLHGAKGLEFPQVYMVGMEEGLLPHERSLDSTSGIDEERRLAYVGVTRAKDRLTLTRAETRRRFGQRRATQPSRFLPEMFGLPESGPASTGRGGSQGARGRKPSHRPRSAGPRGSR
ncbi:ATP-dependent DNA helicase PcrA [Planctomycetes bacterium Pan216]|uniref:DNA 3'-5' helicase n=1 Tax=Kolteria novifilia TaxID=2527975 RepID=A0A518BCI3_9BACT|nr:ATP-dependent DNA helicase PcrA [Planctomycetes bacterium Pan216]